jgi:hypothetical protein
MKKDDLRATAATLGGGVPQVGRAKGEQDRGRASPGRSCAHDDFDPAEIRRVAGDRVYQGKECDPPGPGVRRKEAEFRGSALSGQGVLRLDRRSRRSRDTGVHPEAGSEGRSARATQPVALIDHLQVVKEMGAASATPNSPGSAGGYLL